MYSRSSRSSSRMSWSTLSTSSFPPVSLTLSLAESSLSSSSSLTITVAFSLAASSAAFVDSISDSSLAVTKTCFRLRIPAGIGELLRGCCWSCCFWPGDGVRLVPACRTRTTLPLPPGADRIDGEELGLDVEDDDTNERGVGGEDLTATAGGGVDLTATMGETEPADLGGSLFVAVTSIVLPDSLESEVFLRGSGTRPLRLARISATFLFSTGDSPDPGLPLSLTSNICPPEYCKMFLVSRFLRCSGGTATMYKFSFVVVVTIGVPGNDLRAVATGPVAGIVILVDGTTIGHGVLGLLTTVDAGGGGRGVGASGKVGCGEGAAEDEGMFILGGGGRGAATRGAKRGGCGCCGSCLLCVVCCSKEETILGGGGCGSIVLKFGIVGIGTGCWIRVDGMGRDGVVGSTIGVCPWSGAADDRGGGAAS